MPSLHTILPLMYLTLLGFKVLEFFGNLLRRQCLGSLSVSGKHSSRRLEGILFKELTGLVLVEALLVSRVHMGMLLMGCGTFGEFTFIVVVESAYRLHMINCPIAALDALDPTKV